MPLFGLNLAKTVDRGIVVSYDTLGIRATRQGVNSGVRNAEGGSSAPFFQLFVTPMPLASFVAASTKARNPEGAMGGVSGNSIVTKYISFAFDE